jgi:hypothetical protein
MACIIYPSSCNSSTYNKQAINKLQAIISATRVVVPLSNQAVGKCGKNSIRIPLEVNPECKGNSMLQVLKV